MRNGKMCIREILVCEIPIMQGVGVMAFHIKQNAPLGDLHCDWYKLLMSIAQES